MMAQSNQKQVEALSEISDIIVQISDEDLARMESLGEHIARFDRELGSRILDACSLLIQLNDDVEAALERLEPDVDEDIEDIEDEDLEAAEAATDQTDAEDEEDERQEQGKARSKRKK
jgi:hypothetical protein